MAQGKKTDPKQELWMVERYRAGYSIYRIAKHVGCAPQTVHSVLKRHGVALRTRGGRIVRLLTAAEREAVVQRYKTGDHAGVIAADLRVGLKLVYDVLRENSVPLRGKGQQPWKPTAQELDQIRELARSGVRAYGISRKMGHGTETIERVLRENGIEAGKGALKGSESTSWKGGRVRINGYVHVYVERDDPLFEMCVSEKHPYAPEHRVVMARHLGRTLSKDESVHHINGDREDNRIGNLQLRHRYHGKGHAAICLDCGSTNIKAAELA